MAARVMRPKERGSRQRSGRRQARGVCGGCCGFPHRASHALAWRARDNAARESAAIANASGANESSRTALHPYDVNKPPDRKEPMTMVPNTTKSLNDCTRVFSSGRWHPSTRAVPAILHGHVPGRDLRRRGPVFPLRRRRLRAAGTALARAVGHHGGRRRRRGDRSATRHRDASRARPPGTPAAR